MSFRQPRLVLIYPQTRPLPLIPPPLQIFLNIPPTPHPPSNLVKMKRIFSYPTLSSFAYSLQIITQKINGKLNFQLQYITHPTYILHIH